MQNSKFQIQVGCHADQLYHIKNDELNRPPNIVLEYPATDETLKIASPFGGLIYILVSFKFDCTYFLVATNFLHVVLSIFLTTYYNKYWSQHCTLNYSLSNEVLWHIVTIIAVVIGHGVLLKTQNLLLISLALNTGSHSSSFLPT